MKPTKPTVPRPPKASRKGAEIKVTETAFPAKIVEILGSTGGKQNCALVQVKVLAGQDANKIIRRNVLGPIRIGDVLMLKETEIEARPLRGGRRQAK